ncbi:MAG: triose-phosphate isomerase [Dermatophilaceae bacterium]
MTGRHKLFAPWKNQVSLAHSLTRAAAAVEAAARTGDLFELSVCPSMTALASVARVSANKVTADNAEAYFTQPDIDGGLVGAASQDLTSFQALITATVTTYQRPQPGTRHQSSVATINNPRRPLRHRDDT